MNIFAVSKSPRVCSRVLDDLRLSKMILETCQILCTVLNLEAGKQVTPYRNSHATNRLIKWAAESDANWCWLWELGEGYGNEFIYRRGHKHASHLVIQGLSFRAPIKLECGDQPKQWINAASNKSLDLDFTHLPVHRAYREYLATRWDLQSKTPRKDGRIVPPYWTRRESPFWY